MEEKILEVETLYIQNTTGNNYTIETGGRRCKPMKLNFTGMEGVQFNLSRALELKTSYLQMGEGQNKMCSMRFAFPCNLVVKAQLGKVVIESF